METLFGWPRARFLEAADLVMGHKSIYSIGLDHDGRRNSQHPSVGFLGVKYTFTLH